MHEMADRFDVHSSLELGLSVLQPSEHLHGKIWKEPPVEECSSLNFGIFGEEHSSIENARAAAIGLGLSG